MNVNPLNKNNTNVLCFDVPKTIEVIKKNIKILITYPIIPIYL